jgi:SAM-dependent methyltransferase|tara:strand:- start:60 stop:746 length:687 start_codon:yes stop_codon:yes gene_type:complete
MDIEKEIKKQNNIKLNHEKWNDEGKWINDGEEWSGHFGTTDILWDTILYPKIGEFIKGNVLEIAPGKGRITRKLLEYDIKLDILDLSPICIDRCKERFSSKVDNYYVGNGSDLRDINSGSKDFVLSFDSFVHMSEEVIDSYLNEIYRVLKPGGYCWIHHANLSGQENNFLNWAGRSSMTNEKFHQLAIGNELKVEHQEYIRWDSVDLVGGKNINLPEWFKDGLSLVRK